jgi:hypothetical protein
MSRRQTDGPSSMVATTAWAWVPRPPATRWPVYGRRPIAASPIRLDVHGAREKSALLGNAKPNGSEVLTLPPLSPAFRRRRAVAAGGLRSA